MLALTAHHEKSQSFSRALNFQIHDARKGDIPFINGRLGRLPRSMHPEVVEPFDGEVPSFHAVRALRVAASI
jgi:hypothetical protein